MAQITGARVTAEDYFKLPETNNPMMLLDGEIIELPTPKIPHQKVVVRLVKLLTPILPNGELMVAPMDVHLDDENVPQPDVFWVSGPQSLCKEGEDGWWHGAPDLVIEVLSPSTARYDRREKFQLYQKHGVREYWLVDPIALYVEVWLLMNKQFVQQGIYGPDEEFESPILGNRQIDLKNLFAGMSIQE